MSVPVFSVRSLCVAFRRRGALQPVVDGISFDIEAGETIALVGESGSGKSVTALALMGLLPRSLAETRAQSIRLGDREMAHASAAQWQKIRGAQMAMIFQEPASALDPVFTVGSQIMRALQRRDACGKTIARERAVAALAEVGFPDPGEVARRYPHQLSGGMRQLAMIAMAMAVRPRLLVADEPTTALDVTTQALVLEKLEALQRRHGTAVLLVTHDLGVAARCARRAMVMYCGRLVEQGPYAQLYRRPRHPYTRGLIDAVPRLATGGPGHVRGIPGRIPALSAWPQGCHFSDRCERADALCRQQFPPAEEHDGVRVACHHPL
ncbi:MAG: ABC transporter ATP-binding protein [Xanthomonadales bacterium]|nr:ABC transporter ATP-binding protein [Xanthomonadales bacterium]